LQSHALFSRKAPKQKLVSYEPPTRQCQIDRSITNCSSHALPTRQFHILFTHLAVCCFIFPSRYLFAIGLLPILCLGWRLPPVLGLHSQAARLGEHSALARQGGLPLAWSTGLSPSVARGFHRACNHPEPDTGVCSANHIPTTARKTAMPPRCHSRFQVWACPASLAVTEGVLVSFFSSA